MNPIMTAIHRWIPTRSPRIGVESASTIKGEVKLMMAAVVRGM